MNERDLRRLLEGVRSGAIPADEAVAELRRLPFADLGMATIDHHRALRQGMPEAVYAPGKSVAQCVAVVAELLLNGSGPVLVSRADREQGDALIAAFPDSPAQHTPTGANRATIVWRAAQVRKASIAVVSAGTADAPVVAECVATLRAHGLVADEIADCGVAGLHRLLARLDRITSAEVVIAVAGMEGALASVLGGLTAAPVIAVPTSVGYGASLEGVTALLAMLASCAAGISVVGIDNGYGAACAAVRVFHAHGGGVSPVSGTSH